jgi:hypothetical protein
MWLGKQWEPMGSIVLFWLQIKYSLFEDACNSECRKYEEIGFLTILFASLHTFIPENSQLELLHLMSR